MAAVGGNIIVRFTYTGEEDIPDNVTHVTVINVRVVRRIAFSQHPSIVEVICHEEVEKIEEYAFICCPCLKRVIMPGVKIVKERAFYQCAALTDVECDKLEIIEEGAFYRNESLVSINLPSARIVGEIAFRSCIALADVKFSNKLDRFKEKAFFACPSLERITIPLKDSMIPDDNVFLLCEKLNYVNLVEGALHETIAALHSEEWRQDMKEEINSIHQILPSADPGGEWDNYIDDYNAGDKAGAIRRWIRSLIHKINRYKEEHQNILNDAATTLQLALPQDTLMNNVLPFLDLPSYTFEDHDESEEGEEDDSEEEEMEVNL